MLSWFRKKSRCKHYKSFGDEYPSNMFLLVRFSPYKHDRIGFGIRECSICGKRAFSTMYLHLMSQNKCDIIDDFILRRIDFNTFKQFLDKEMAWVKVSTGNQQGVSDALQKLW